MKPVPPSAIGLKVSMHLTQVSMILCGLGFSLYAFTATYTGHFWVMFTDMSSPSSPVSTAISVSTL